MKQKKRIVTALVTVGAIVAAAQLMQHGNSLSALNPAAPPVTTAGMVTTPTPQPEETAAAETPETAAPDPEETAAAEAPETGLPETTAPETAEAPEATDIPDPAIVTEAVQPEPLVPAPPVPAPDTAPDTETADAAPETTPETGPAPETDSEMAEAPESPAPETPAGETGAVAEAPETVVPETPTESEPEIAEAPEDAPDEATDPDGIALAALDEKPTPAAPETPVVAPEMPAEAEAPGPLPLPKRDLPDRVTAADTAVPDDMAEPPARNEYGLTCGIVLSASEQRSAMVKLTVTAPCRPDQRITVRHAGMVFSAETDGLGDYRVVIPALAAEAEFEVTFLDGTRAETALTVPQAAATERVVLQFNGKTGLQIHALEFGADYGDPGHIWSGNARDATLAMKVGGGFLTALGDPGLKDAFIAQVYTLPPQTSGRDGVVRLNVEAEVTEDNCGHDIAGQTIQRTAEGTMRPVSLTLSMPDCDAVGEFLVLKNLLRDLKIASN
ncbi:hypothetical protein P1J78_12875 [Psychromarinibacter sp. C21-152]|uniref:Translocase n=1 Tax=Psychromarinibacter sediminicola TaxID=3033385 RepID=A0AAE3NT79_9RHOB|nr:hypothetical protein [Psychromarinibacter sediminicola]MDF0601631.1 hypothetical protein [Psychromarinibacter sediminicola]